MARFPLGQIVATPGALQLAREHEIFLARLVIRHARCDWGDVVEEDKQANDRALETGGRLLSAYSGDGWKLWIITEGEDMEGNRQATTILQPDEY